MPRAPNVDEYIANHPDHATALEKLRGVLTSFPDLEETIKWGAPTYTVDGKNVVGLGAFKAYAGIWFFNGVYLQDPDGVLVNAQDGKTKALRQWRFTTAKEIKVTRVKAYVKEAIANQKQGKELKPARGATVVLPPELKTALAKNKRVKLAFEKLSPGKQRDYAEHIASAKREATKSSRLEKILPMIAQGVGLNDKYRNC